MRLLLLGLLPGCAEPAEGQLLSGFSLTWDALSHRVSSLDVAAPHDGGAELGLIGGDWSTGEHAADHVAWTLHRSRVSSRRLAFAGATTTLTLRAPFTEDLTLTVADPALQGWPTLDAAIASLRVRTDVPQSPDFPSDYDPADGWPLLALGLEVLDVRPTAEGAELDLRATMTPGPTGERVLDRPQMDAALPLATLELELGVTVVAHQGDAFTVAVQGALDQPYDPPYSDHQPLILPLEPADRPAAFAWRAARWTLNGGPGNHGDYVRALGLSARPDEATALASGSSLLEIAPLHVAFEGEVLALDPRDLTVEERTTSGEADPGTWSAD